MLHNYKTYPDKLEPNIVLHEWECQGQVWHGVDTYVPLFEENMPNFDRLISFESAMGFRLRYNTEIDETYYIPPAPVENGHIKRLLNTYSDKIRSTNTPLMIGFKYDGMIPSDCSHKNTVSVVEHAINAIRKPVMISTAYTPSNEIRVLSGKSNGMIVFEIKIPGIMGVATQSLRQVGFNTRRLHYYGNGTGFFLRFGPLVLGAVNENLVNISSFWAKITSALPGDNTTLRTDCHRGNRLFIPNEPIVPSEYLELLDCPQIKPLKAKGIPISTSDITRVLEDAWRNNLRIEIIGHETSQDPKLCSPILDSSSQCKIPKRAVQEFIDEDRKYNQLIGSGITFNIDDLE